MKPPTSSSERGYGALHKRHRRRLLALLEEGTPCPVCGMPMYLDPKKNFDEAPLEADHPPGHAQKYATNKRANPPRRLLHRRCNRSGGAWDKPPPPNTPPGAEQTPTTTPPFTW